MSEKNIILNAVYSCENVTKSKTNFSKLCWEIIFTNSINISKSMYVYVCAYFPKTKDVVLFYTLIYHWECVLKWFHENIFRLFLGYEDNNWIWTGPQQWAVSVGWTCRIQYKWEWHISILCVRVHPNTHTTRITFPWGVISVWLENSWCGKVSNRWREGREMERENEKEKERREKERERGGWGGEVI